MLRGGRARAEGRQGDGRSVRVLRGASGPGEWIREVGSDVAAGQRVLERGALLRLPVGSP